jgi:hypothetical protein
MLPALEATPGRKSWIVRPAGALGTCGWIGGRAWEAVYVPFRGNFGRPVDAALAVRMAAGRVWCGFEVMP